MLCEILEMRDSSGSDTATWGDDIQETVEWVTRCFFSPPSFSYRHFRVLGSIGCAQTVFARGTFKASILSTYIPFIRRRERSGVLPSNVTDVL